MALESSGSMSIGGSTSGRSINLELGRSATATSSLGETDLRTLAGVASGAISMSNFYGASGAVAYTGYALNRSAANGGGGAADGGTVQSGNAGSQSNVGGTATFSTGISYTTLRVIYGNMANGQLGNSASGAVLSINGSSVTAAGTYGQNGYPSNYIKYYDASNGTLNSVGISAGVSGSHESHIVAIIIDGSKLLATGPEY